MRTMTIYTIPKIDPEREAAFMARVSALTPEQIRTTAATRMS
jgi:hypothetical protein